MCLSQFCSPPPLAISSALLLRPTPEVISSAAVSADQPQPMRAPVMLCWAAGALAVVALLAASPVAAFYLPGVAPNDFHKDDGGDEMKEAVAPKNSQRSRRLDIWSLIHGCRASCD